jgi:hypothetical protein
MDLEQMKNQPQTSLGTLRMVVICLVMALIFAGGGLALVRSVGPGSPAPPGAAGQSGQPVNIYLLMLAAYVPMSYIAAFVFRSLYCAAARKKFTPTSDHDSDQRALISRFSAMTILCCSLLEGAGLLGAVVHYLTGNLQALIPVALSAFVMLLFFPSDGRFAAFERDVTGRVSS